MSRARVYVSFDIEHDRELYERLRAESGGAGFSVSGGSEYLSATDVWDASVRRRIREADEVIVICGEHSGSSTGMSSELRIAREERTPYFLLWGRRETMCTKPSGASSGDGIYMWTREVVRDQVAIGLRRARALARSVRSDPGIGST